MAQYADVSVIKGTTAVKLKPKKPVKQQEPDVLDETAIKRAFAFKCQDCFWIVKEGKRWFIGLMNDDNCCSTCGHRLDEDCSTKANYAKQRHHHVELFKQRFNINDDELHDSDAVANIFTNLVCCFAGFIYDRVLLFSFRSNCCEDATSATFACKRRNLRTLIFSATKTTMKMLRNHPLEVLMHTWMKLCMRLMQKSPVALINVMLLVLIHWTELRPSLCWTSSRGHSRLPRQRNVYLATGPRLCHCKSSYLPFAPFPVFHPSICFPLSLQYHPHIHLSHFQFCRQSAL